MTVRLPSAWAAATRPSSAPGKGVSGGPDAPCGPFDPPSLEAGGATGDALLNWLVTQPEMRTAIAIAAIAPGAIGTAVARAPGRRLGPGSLLVVETTRLLGGEDAAGVRRRAIVLQPSCGVSLRPRDPGYQAAPT